MTEREQSALGFLHQQIQSLDIIHQEALNALNAVQGNERLQKWKKQVVLAVTEHISQEQGKRLSKDWLETSYVAGDLFDELSDDVEMCRRHLKRLAKEIQTNGLPPE
ncbi:MAG: hypothetical protein JSU59_07620 [Nitrospirota bacterium]|nr:MAG: hypothetical protein JSU59_07620 [Nitrospirota bacterium]